MAFGSGLVECDIHSAMGGSSQAPDRVSDGGDNTSLRKVHVVVLVLFVVQIITVYTGYEWYTRLDRKYESKYRDLRQLLQGYERSPRIRFRRDTGIQDNSVGKSSTDNGSKMMETESQPAKNGSTEIVEEIMNLKPNFSDKAWIWLNDYSRVPVSCR